MAFSAQLQIPPGANYITLITFHISIFKACSLAFFKFSPGCDGYDLEAAASWFLNRKAHREIKINKNEFLLLKKKRRKKRESDRTARGSSPFCNRGHLLHSLESLVTSGHSIFTPPSPPSPLLKVSSQPRCRYGTVSHQGHSTAQHLQNLDGVRLA